MRTTTRIRLYQRDILEYIEWGTPVGSVTFKPLDNNYQSDYYEGRLFRMLITRYDNDDVISIDGTSKGLIQKINKMIIKGEKQ